MRTGHCLSHCTVAVGSSGIATFSTGWVWPQSLRLCGFLWLRQSRRRHFRKPFFITCFDHAITVLLLPALNVYHRVRNQNSGMRADKWGFVAVLERHSLHPLRKLFKMAVVLNSVYIIVDYM
ncbi:hypothetical protein PI124_g21584 [Phytophthora idaei]|nr:hypothetical protein PI125_g21745 [Phytophthora idaei]KAG3128518.1 hypothetical protein PI126_g21365 [Phytophthora idaei]KAG3233340.1 hypothetical protein PI124_g21584 [Phytophthora idaei]